MLEYLPFLYTSLHKPDEKLKKKNKKNNILLNPGHPTKVCVTILSLSSIVNEEKAIFITCTRFVYHDKPNSSLLSYKLTAILLSHPYLSLTVFVFLSAGLSACLLVKSSNLSHERVVFKKKEMNRN